MAASAQRNAASGEGAEAALPRLWKLWKLLDGMLIGPAVVGN